MSNINVLVSESFNHVGNKDPVNNLINISAVAAALYHIYINSRNQPDKVAAAVNSLPQAVMQGLTVAMAGHTLKDLANGNYSYDPKHGILYGNTRMQYTPDGYYMSRDHSHSHSNYPTPYHHSQHNYNHYGQ